MDSAGMQRFEGTETYVATQYLQVAVNASIALERPLLIKGEPGTGKTILAHEIARALGLDLITWHIKSTTKAQQGLYEYDAVSRLRDGQLGDERVHDIANYIKPGKLWDAFTAEAAPVLLIDEVHEALTIFYDIREVPGLKKKPSTSELLDWLKLLLFEDIPPEVLRTRDPKKLIPPLHGALLKNEQDVHLFERLAFLNRRERG